MIRLLMLAATVLLVANSAAQAEPRLERVVIVMRHGVRPPIQTSAELAKYADRPWPAWSVGPGELTPHGGETVRLMGDTIGRVYRDKRLLPRGCAKPGEIFVWSDGADERTRETGRILAEALEPGCGLKAPFADIHPRDPIFGGYDQGACKVDAAKVMQAMEAKPRSHAGLSRPLGPAYARLQSVFAPKACAGGAGTCFTADGSGARDGVFPATGSLAEDLLLEYADGKPMSEVGWGRADAADIAAVMPIHERAFALIRDNSYSASRRGAPMAKVILDALAGEPTSGGPRTGRDLRLLALAGHDTNLVLMASVFGLRWTLPGEPDATAPSTALAFELWSDQGRRYVRPVIYYETLEQLRTLKPAMAKALPLRFEGCSEGPMGSCPLARLRAHAAAVIPADCESLQ
jgi:4-phytase/acid phosphatase